MISELSNTRCIVPVTYTHDIMFNSTSVIIIMCCAVVAWTHEHPEHRGIEQYKPKPFLQLCTHILSHYSKYWIHLRITNAVSFILPACFILHLLRRRCWFQCTNSWPVQGHRLLEHVHSTIGWAAEEVINHIADGEQKCCWGASVKVTSTPSFRKVKTRQLPDFLANEYGILNWVLCLDLTWIKNKVFH